jgi:hypothetical protein
MAQIPPNVDLNWIGHGRLDLGMLALGLALVVAGPAFAGPGTADTAVIYNPLSNTVYDPRCLSPVKPACVRWKEGSVTFILTKETADERQHH